MGIAFPTPPVRGRCSPLLRCVGVARALTIYYSRGLEQCGTPLSLDTPVPNHAGFTIYAPSFTLDVPPSNVRDENTEGYLVKVDAIFEHVAEILQTLQTF